MDLHVCAAECLDVHVGNGFPEAYGGPVNALLNEVTYLLPAFFGIAEEGLGHILRKNFSGGDIEKRIRIASKRIRHEA